MNRQNLLRFRQRVEMAPNPSPLASLYHPDPLNLSLSAPPPIPVPPVMVDAGCQTDAEPPRCHHPGCPSRDGEADGDDDDDDDDDGSTIAAELEESRLAAINEVLEHFAQEQLQREDESE